MMLRLLILELLGIVLLRTAFAAPVPLTDATFSLRDQMGISVTTVPVTGSLDLSAWTLEVNSFQVFGVPATPTFELLGPATYTNSDGDGGTITATVGPDQLGAYIVINYNDYQYRMFNVWDISPSSTGGDVFTAVDSDGDGVPGHALQGGALPGYSAIFEFSAGPPQPVVVKLQIPGGTAQECSMTGGSEVAMTATVQTVGDMDLGSIEWWIDGEVAGTGLSLTQFLALGSHSVEVIATTTTGESYSDSATVVIRDTTSPVLILGFLYRSGKPITSVTGTKAQLVGVNIEARDVCDPAPTTDGTVKPVYEVYPVQDGDSIRISKPASGGINLPASALELRGSAQDASGNSVGPSLQLLEILN